MNRQEWEKTFEWATRYRDMVAQGWPLSPTLFAYRYFNEQELEVGYWIVGGVSRAVGKGTTLQPPRHWNRAWFLKLEKDS